MMMNKTRDQKQLKIMIFGNDMLLWYNRKTFNDNPGLAGWWAGLMKNVRS
jgi:hypothetical protein